MNKIKPACGPIAPKTVKVVINAPRIKDRVVMTGLISEDVCQNIIQLCLEDGVASGIWTKRKAQNLMNRLGMRRSL